MSYYDNLQLQHNVNLDEIVIRAARYNISSTEIIDSGATVDYWANQLIRMQPGFHAKQGSLVHAKIGHLSCVPGRYSMSVQMLNSVVPLGENLCFMQTNAQRYLLGIFENDIDIKWFDGSTLYSQICNKIEGDDYYEIVPGHYTVKLILINENDSLVETFPLEVVDSAHHSGGPFYKTKGVDKEEITDIYRTSSSDFSVDVFPNPTQGKVTLQVTSSKQTPYSIEIISPTGSLLYKIERITENRIVIDKTGFPSGVYFIRLNNGEQIVTKKMIINK
ncbi:MAG: T9SS type A sorting domain-containing protein [Bacteroidales bacterium]|nr:T9SS type A sorting domain-containing protein [Bacteroidales bacterium]